MKLIHKYDSKTKLYTEDELISAEAVTESTTAKTYPIPPNATDIQPVGFHVPKWRGKAWVEGDVPARDTFKSGLVATQYQSDRAAEYAKLNQEELRFDDMINGTTTWKDTILAIKAKYPKPLSTTLG